MKRHILTLTSAIMIALTAAAGDIHVAADRGRDMGGGTAADPSGSIEAALRMAREWRRLGDVRCEGGIRIILHGGTYHVTRPLFIRPEDSGTPASPAVICGAEGETAVISGGVRVTGWHKGCDDPRLPSAVRSKVWTADAPMVDGRITETRQLWVDGRKMPVASLFGSGVMQRMKNFSTADRSITIPAPPASLFSAPRLEMTVHQRWAIAILRVKEMQDMGNGFTKVRFHEPESSIEFAHPWPQPVIDGERGSSSYALSNALELLDTPGEWYQDYPSGRIYYYPEDDKDVNLKEVTVPVAGRITDICGTRERPVSNITFKNITFAYASWLRPSAEGHVTLQGGFRFIDGYKLERPGLFHKAGLENQAWILRPEAAVAARFARNITFDNCRFTHTGAGAIDFEYAVSSSAISGCRFTDIGGTAITAGYFGEGGFETHIPYSPAVESDICSHLEISRNTITDATNEDWGCTGISAGYVADTRITGNTVSGVNYSGICVGWGWTPLESGMRNNRITGNTVTDYARQLYDAGGIYTLSNQPGSVISGNTISAPYPAPYATNDRAFCIYFDEATDGFTVENNRMVECSYGYNKPGGNMKIK